MRNKKWVRLLAYVTCSVNQELLLQNEYLAAENRILRAKLPSRLRLSDPERATLAEIGKRLGRKALRAVVGGIRAALRLLRKWKPWWCEWRERTPAGDMTASSEP